MSAALTGQGSDRGEQEARRAEAAGPPRDAKAEEVKAPTAVITPRTPATEKTVLLDDDRGVLEVNESVLKDFCGVPEDNVVAMYFDGKNPLPADEVARKIINHGATSLITDFNLEFRNADGEKTGKELRSTDVIWELVRQAPDKAKGMVFIVVTGNRRDAEDAVRELNEGLFKEKGLNSIRIVDKPYKLDDLAATFEESLANANPI